MFKDRRELDDFFSELADYASRGQGHGEGAVDMEHGQSQSHSVNDKNWMELMKSFHDKSVLCSELEADKEKLEGENKRLCRELSTLRTEKNKLSRDLEEAKDESDRSRNELDALSRTRRRVSSVKAPTAPSSVNEDLARDNLELRRKVQEFQQRISSLEEKLASCDDEMHRMEEAWVEEMHRMEEAWEQEYLDKESQLHDRIEELQRMLLEAHQHQHQHQHQQYQHQHQWSMPRQESMEMFSELPHAVHADLHPTIAEELVVVAEELELPPSFPPASSLAAELGSFSPPAASPKHSPGQFSPPAASPKHSPGQAAARRSGEGSVIRARSGEGPVALKQSPPSAPRVPRPKSGEGSLLCLPPTPPARALPRCTSEASTLRNRCRAKMELQAAAAAAGVSVAVQGAPIAPAEGVQGGGGGSSGSAVVPHTPQLRTALTASALVWIPYGRLLALFFFLFHLLPCLLLVALDILTSQGVPSYLTPT